MYKKIFTFLLFIFVFSCTKNRDVSGDWIFVSGFGTQRIAMGVVMELQLNTDKTCKVIQRAVHPNGKKKVSIEKGSYTLKGRFIKFKLKKVKGTLKGLNNTVWNILYKTERKLMLRHKNNDYKFIRKKPAG